MGGPDTVVLLSRLCVRREDKDCEDPARDPESNLMTLDNMKPERGMWVVKNIQTHLWGVLDGQCVGKMCISNFSGMTVPALLREESGQGII